MKSFSELGLPSNICDALAARGILEPFEIQAATIEDALAGRDVCGRAPTGSGKTLAFGLPLVATVSRANPKAPRALILAPTRELADQIYVELASFSGKVRVGVVYGGVGYGPQLNLLRKGVDILVACPGRLEDLIDRGDVSLHEVKQVVLDEADRMADMGFMPAVRRILDQTSKKRTSQSSLVTTRTIQPAMRLETRLQTSRRLATSSGMRRRKTDSPSPPTQSMQCGQRSSSPAPAMVRIGSPSSWPATASRPQRYTADEARANAREHLLTLPRTEFMH